MNVLPKKPTSKQITEFLQGNASLGKRLAAILDEISPEVKAIIDSGVGWELLQDDVKKWQVLAVKVLGNEATDVERQECKYLTFERIPRVAKKIAVYYKAMGIISTSNKDTDNG